jgi:DNA repair exonuclease SbcCD ATPase subunit
LDFAERFTIIDGRNGVGKSTIFDAIEFALTGGLSKYEDATAHGETVADYLWWTGGGPPPEDRYVEVDFRNLDGEIRLRRTPLEPPTRETLDKLTAALCDIPIAPTDPLTQLCTTAIIRDERITALSLDLKETDRYSLLRDALGANQAEKWITRAARLAALAKRRTTAAQNEATAANSDLAATGRRLDQVRATIVADSVIGDAVSRLRAFTGSQVSPDQLAGPVRERIAALSAEVDALDTLVARWASVDEERTRLVQLSSAVEAAKAESATVRMSGMAGITPEISVYRQASWPP